MRTPASCGARRRCPFASPDPRTSCAMASATALRAHLARHRDRARCSSCRSSDSVKISRLKLANRSSELRRLVVTHYARVGARQSAQPDGALHRHGDRPRRPPRCSRAIPGASISRTRVAFMDMGGRQQTEHRRPRGIPGPLRLAGRARGAARGRALVESRGRRTRPLRRAADRCSSSSPGEETELVLLLGQEASQEPRRSPASQRYRGARSRRRAQGGHRFLGPDARARSR